MAQRKARGNLEDLWVCPYCENDIFVNKKILLRKERLIEDKRRQHAVAVKMQAQYRSHLKHREFAKQRSGAKVFQACMRGYVPLPERRG
jgi:hypothetical protein